MFENLDELIDLNLKLIFRERDQKGWLYGLQNHLGNNLRESERLAEIMYNKGLVDIKGENVLLTEMGYEICKTGSWLKVVETQKLLDKKEEAEQKLREQTEMVQSEKVIYDYRLAKWKVKTFWPLFAFAVIGAGLSLYNFIILLSPSKNQEQQELRIEQMESDMSKLRSMISNKISLDSLPNKTRRDSLTINEKN